MLDPRMLREHPETLREAIRRRGKLALHGPDLDEAAGLERARREAIRRVEEQKAARNAVTQEVARRKKAGEDAADLMARARALGEEIAGLEQDLDATQRRLDAILLGLPNVTLPDVPEGDEGANRVVASWGEPRAEGSVRPHWEVGAERGLLDLERGAKLSGSGFIVYRAGGARLIRAMMQAMLDLHTGEFGYEEVWVPSLVNRATMTGTGQLPKFADDMYKVESDDLFLIPTSEVPITNLYRDEILAATDLPRGFTAFSPCFRREAGSAGKDTRGVLRVHEFGKVELVRYCAPEDGEANLELLVSHARAVLERLGLPYRIVLLAAGDTGFASARTYDLEVFAPGVGKWLEVSSCSLCTDFQARRANIRYRPAAGEKPRFVHTLNGSGLAFPRVFAAILEHHQRPDGSVTVPAFLRPYVGRETL